MASKRYSRGQKGLRSIVDHVLTLLEKTVLGKLGVDSPIHLVGLGWSKCGE